MALSHKAYAFAWDAFDLDLRPLLVGALAANDTARLGAYIDAHRAELTDPYEGEPLPPDWRAMLENRDVHEFGDYALTRYYDPADDWGLAEGWVGASEGLSDAAGALLGFGVGPPGQQFDPGRCGSYFQTPELVRESLAVLRPLAVPALAQFVTLLERCAAEGRGVYVTF